MSYGYPPQDPYGQNPHGQPYGPQGGYGSYDYGSYGEYGPYGTYGPYGPYGGYGPHRPPSNGSAIAALVCNILLLFCCMPLSIPGIVMSALALGKINHEPESARKLTIWAWVCFGIGLVVALCLLALVFANADSGDDTGSYQRA